MAFQSPGKMIPGLVAGADLSAAAAQFTFVKISASGTVVQCSAVTDRPIGILQNRPASGEAAQVMADGVSKVRANADLAAGDQIGTHSNGRAAAYAPGTDTTKYIVGQVIQIDASDNDGALVTAAFNCLSAARGA